MFSHTSSNLNNFLIAPQTHYSDDNNNMEQVYNNWYHLRLVGVSRTQCLFLPITAVHQMKCNKLCIENKAHASVCDMACTSSPPPRHEVIRSDSRGGCRISHSVWYSISSTLHDTIHRLRRVSQSLQLLVNNETSGGKQHKIKFPPVLKEPREVWIWAGLK